MRLTTKTNCRFASSNLRCRISWSLILNLLVFFHLYASKLCFYSLLQFRFRRCCIRCWLFLTTTAADTANQTPHNIQHTHQCNADNDKRIDKRNIARCQQQMRMTDHRFVLDHIDRSLYAACKLCCNTISLCSI